MSDATYDVSFPTQLTCFDRRVQHAILDGITPDELMRSLAGSMQDTYRAAPITVIASALDETGFAYDPQEVEMKVLGYMPHPDSTIEHPLAIVLCLVKPADASKLDMRLRHTGDHAGDFNIAYFAWNIR